MIVDSSKDLSFTRGTKKLLFPKDQARGASWLPRNFH